MDPEQTVHPEAFDFSGSVYSFVFLHVTGDQGPLPMVDELLISGGLVVLSWNYLAKRDTRSSVAQRRRYELKLRCGEREEEIDEQLFAVESFLDEVSSEDPLELCNSLALVSSQPLKPISYEGRMRHSRNLVKCWLATYASTTRVSTGWH